MKYDRKLDVKALADTLATIIAERRVTQSEVAAATQLSPSTLTRLLKYHQEPSVSGAMSLCAWMGVRLDRCGVQA